MWNEGGDPGTVPVSVSSGGGGGGGGSVGSGGGMECLQLQGGGTTSHHSQSHHQAPFHYLISEQAKSLAALQELQHEVGALLEFRDLVMETFPNLRTKLMGSSTQNTMSTAHHHNSNIPVSIRAGDWTPGVRIRKKIGSKDESRSSKKTDTTVQDSGFSTETSSKETHSASSTVPASSSAPGAPETSSDPVDVEDELYHLLDVIHRKGVRLKDEADALQGALRTSGGFQRALFRPTSEEDATQLRRERDLLLDRLAEAEAEVVAGRVRAERMREELESLQQAKVEVEEQLRAVVTQRGEVNSRIHDLHLQFVTKSGAVSPDVSSEKPKFPSDSRRDQTSATITPLSTITTSAISGQRTHRKSELDSALGDKLPKVRSPDKKKISAILREQDLLVLQKHLLTTTVQNQVLQEQLDSAVSLEIGLRDKLNKFREENDDLRFQLEDRNIELEGTRARVRVLEDLHHTPKSSPDIIPTTESSPLERPTRSEITTASMKAMSPLPQMDQHSSSTESAQDQKEGERRRRPPSKIPLKSYTTPTKPPQGKHSSSCVTPSSGSRSRSGGSPGRPHSAQSCRHHRSSDGNSLPKSRNSSLVTARDSLSSKLRSSDSLLKARAKETTSSNGNGEKVRSKTTSSIWSFFRRDNQT